MLMGVILVLNALSQAQPPDSLWNRTFGGDDDEYGESVQQTSDGGFIIAGSTYSYGAGQWDAYLIKTDNSGIEEWSQTFGGIWSDWGYSVQQTSDGGYIIAGYTRSYGAGGADFYLFKTDALGNEEWGRAFGGSDEDEGRSVQQTNDGGYIMVGFTYSYGAGSSDVYLIKTDTLGIVQWDQTFGGYSMDGGRSVQQTSDGGYIIAGSTWSYGAGGADLYLIKADSTGNQEWVRTFGGYNCDYGETVQETSDGGYIITGSTGGDFGIVDFDLYLVKTDASGIEQWSRIFGGDNYDWGYDVQQTTDAGYIIAGYTWHYGHNSRDVYLIKTNTSGIPQWTQTFGWYNYDCGYSVQETWDYGYIITGYTESYGAGGTDVWLIKTQPDPILPVRNIEVSNNPSAFVLYPPYPNPFNPTTSFSFTLPESSPVKLEVFNIHGCCIGIGCAPTLNYPPGTHKIRLDCSNIPSGIYIYRLTAGEFTNSGKMLLMK